MKKVRVGVFLIVAMIMSACTTTPSTAANQKKIIVSYDDSKKADVLKAIHLKKINIVNELPNFKMIIISVPENDLEHDIHYLKKTPGILNVEKDNEVKIQK
ncbi:hypothetical protein R4483_07245 [Acinetobacter baumannii]|uniref:hypothetical protein n=1 Tax=Acinetobacter calcoaceticus/baumannii complex TaxID=909768 RepID=UPI000837D46E|nr:MULTISPECIES: hypothetical protein [Acinetobacter calcoaceticus/baumannii complex]MDH2526510.1 hypothetical protein [Acinetobacter baumannii]MDV7432861.1 hypothetical protein [Acinetobacter baumannii]OCY54576.1 hypothetical protein BFR81_01200 [Acinetobacter pittii]